jgi:2-amino-4-hydroxy-6-hydroxymethyldihydropteridine diphosphokinase
MSRLSFEGSSFGIALMARVLLCMGSNLGDRGRYLALAEQELCSRSDVQILRKSPILETDPMDFLEQPSFYNQILEIDTGLEPQELLDTCQSVEKKIGRVFRFDKGPREIDIDILTYDNCYIDTERLVIPHHSLDSRSFVKDLITRLESVENFQ